MATKTETLTALTRGKIHFDDEGTGESFEVAFETREDGPTIESITFSGSVVPDVLIAALLRIKGLRR